MKNQLSSITFYVFLTFAGCTMFIISAYAPEFATGFLGFMLVIALITFPIIDGLTEADLLPPVAEPYFSAILCLSLTGYTIGYVYAQNSQILLLMAAPLFFLSLINGIKTVKILNQY